MLPVNLSNGGVVIARAELPAKPGCVPAEIVLCRLPDNGFHPFATWQRNTVEFRGCYHGHYFKTEAEARADFEKRCKSEAALPERKPAGLPAASLFRN